jgi:hypothetical protein
MLCSFLLAVIVNGVLLAYSYGELEARVKHLEKEREEQREEWTAARARIEQAIKEFSSRK